MTVRRNEATRECDKKVREYQRYFSPPPFGSRISLSLSLIFFFFYLFLFFALRIVRKKKSKNEFGKCEKVREKERENLLVRE